MMKPLNNARHFLYACLLFGLSLANASAQQSASTDTDPQSRTPTPVSRTATGGSFSGSEADSQPRKGNPKEAGPAVRIGPGDDLDVTVFGLPDLSQHVRVSNFGDVSLPLIGNLHLAGLSSDEAQALIERHLADGHFLNNPHVSVYVKEYTAEGISVMGEVNRPGVYSPLGGQRLLDLIQTAGGLTNKSGRTVTVTHRDDPQHPTALTFSDDAVKTAENNVGLLPGDAVMVSKAGIVYVVGEVNRPGGFVMEDNKITASQLLAMAAGPTHMAALNSSKMIRRTPTGLKDISLRLNKLLEAKIPDVELQPDDILWVPPSKTKGIASMSTNAIISSLLTLAIYRL